PRVRARRGPEIRALLPRNLVEDVRRERRPGRSAQAGGARRESDRRAVAATPRLRADFVSRDQAVKRLFTLLALLPALAAAEASPGARRFALIIGVNDGGPSRLRLRYAESDAKAVAEVFQQLGGVAESDMMLLLEPDHAQIAARVDELGRRLDAARAKSKRLELIVYYSGHSDEEGLLVRGERIAYTELRQRLDAVPADLRVAILDSGAAGALTRLKGGSSRPPFLLDESSSLKGHAFLTSSAADEVAQESDRVGGSFFTHYLLSAMRGAADVSRSGRVTLTDAYAF